MAVQNLPGTAGMLSQMRAVIQQASGQLGQADGELARHGGFAAELGKSLKRVSSAQTAARARAEAFELGAADVSLNDVIIDMQKASIAFQTTVQVRNRLVAAYQEIAGMPV